jgi:cold shock CspA family protein
VAAGRVIEWKEQGFGFIRDPAEDADLFFHSKDVLDKRAKVVGAQVSYTVVQGRKGRQAVEVRVAEEAPPEGECDVMPEVDFRRYLSGALSTFIDVVVAEARQHGWLE